MLIRIDVRDFAIVSSLELELDAGMTVLTGETGAGKSILIEALGLALGDRADTAAVRTGAERAEVTAVFDLDAVPAARAWLDEQGIAGEGECLLRRVVVRDGRSRAYVNGTPVPVLSLQALGGHLLDIHGQHAHQSLLHRASQRDLLDAYGGHRDLAAQVARAWRGWQALVAEQAAATGSAADRTARLELLTYQVAELAGLDPAIGPARELLDAALIQLKEAAGILRVYRDHLDLEPERLDEVDRRLAAVHEMARKHRVRPEELPELSLIHI
jgi:DNA repair protein RecN (Recombination protein N)